MGAKEIKKNGPLFNLHIIDGIRKNTLKEVKQKKILTINENLRLSNREGKNVVT